MEEKVLSVVKGPVAEVTINRPEIHNALNRAMWESVTELLKSFENDPKIKVVMISGAGTKTFSAGADFAELISVANDPKLSGTLLTAIETTMSTIEQMTKPVIAKVNGAAIGGGCELAAACDLRIAVDTAKFGIPAGRLGIAITRQDTRRLTALVGVGWAQDLLMTGQLIDAVTAQKIGLITRMVSQADLDQEAMTVVESVASMAPLSLKAAKLYTLSVARGQELRTTAEGLVLAQEAWTSEEFQQRIKKKFKR